MKTIVLTGGGTAGHVIPNIALLPNLKKYFDRIVYIGSFNGIERSLVKDYPFVDYHAIETVKFIRKFTLRNLMIPYKLIKGQMQAKELLSSLSPAIVFSKGGFVSLPVVLAAGPLKIPVVSHESDLTLGLANKLIKKRSKVICTAFEETAEKLANGLYAGPLIRRGLFSSTRESGLKVFKLKQNKPVLLVMGGSLGAGVINKNLREVLSKLTLKFQVLHSCGKGNLSNEVHEDYRQYEYISDMASALSAADIVVTRGGSNAIHEILALKKPMLIIPLPKGNSRGDQIENARIFKERGYANVLNQEDLNPGNLIAGIEKTFKESEKIKKNQASFNALDSLNKVTDAILKYRL